MPKLSAVKAKQRCYKTTCVHATAMQCAIATCISSVQTSSQSHQPCTVASRNALTALKSSWARPVEPQPQTPRTKFQNEAGSPPKEGFAYFVYIQHLEYGNRYCCEDGARLHSENLAIPIRAYVPDQCDNAIVNHNLVRFACATEIESELPGCQEIVAKNLS